MNCQCPICSKNLPFELPNEIVEAVFKKEVVIFAGAGISTETKDVFKQTLYEDVYDDLNMNGDIAIDFPSLMSEFCNQKNGRKLLLEKIRSRFEYCQQFDELFRQATKFHNELSSNYYIDSIFTTNWDDYFERICNAIPIVTPEDFAFYNIDARKVFKLHGSISNYGSIVATKEDYNKCYRSLRSGVIGSHLKTALATKIVIFIGFSFSDFDFNRIYSYLKKELKEIIPHIYIVTLDPSFKERFTKEKATVIETDGTFFLSVIREHLEGCKYLIPKENFETVRSCTYLRSTVHHGCAALFLKYKTPTLIYNLYYQDGMQHAFDYLEYNTKSGITFNPHRIFGAIDAYEKLKKEFKAVKNYSTFSYIEGYISGLYSILYGKDFILEDFPLYYIIGYGRVYSDKEFIKLVKSKAIYHKAADKHGQKEFKELLRKESQLIPHHQAFIF